MQTPTKTPPDAALRLGLSHSTLRLQRERERSTPRANTKRFRVNPTHLTHWFDELGRPRLGKGPDASTTRLTLPGQDDPPARVDDAPPAEVPLQGSSPEGRGGCAVA